MKHESSAEIDAPAATVWAVYCDVARWSEWTASVEHAVPPRGIRFPISRARPFGSPTEHENGGESVAGR